MLPICFRFSGKAPPRERENFMEGMRRAGRQTWLDDTELVVAIKE